MLVFRNQAITDQQQLAFTQQLGPLEATKVGTPGADSSIAIFSNFGPDGKILGENHRQLINGRANQLWHADSSYKSIPAKASMLSARILPSKHGNTEFLTMRAAYAALPAKMKRKIASRVAIHDYAYGRSKVDSNLVMEIEREALPPVRQSLVLDHGAYGKSLYLGSHCASIEGMSKTEGRALIGGLMTLAEQPDFIYSHCWREHDMVLWNNRSVMHRATPYEHTKEKRLMVRTTIAGHSPTTPPLRNS